MGFIKKLFGSQSKTISVFEANSMLKRTNELANIANKTTDRDEFYNSINEIKDILRELSKYEGKLPFIGSPSVDLKNLERIEKSQIALLEKRIEEKEKESIFYRKAQNKELDEFDIFVIEAGRLVIEKDKASIGMIQRAFKIGFNRAMRIMYKLYEMGIISEEYDTEPRKVLVNRREYENIIENYHPKIIPESSDVNNICERISLYNNQYDYMEGHDFECFCAELLKKMALSMQKSRKVAAIKV